MTFKPKPLPDQKYLQKILTYCSETGVLTWNQRFNARTKQYEGCIAGYILKTNSGKKYISIEIDQNVYLAHRIIWKMLYNEEPDQIDHDNGNGLDNRLINLNKSNKFINACNHKRRKDNTSGVTGVSFHKRYQKWQVRINNKGQRIHLGNYDTFEEAVRVRKQAEREYNFNPKHGSERPI
ncbi:hypothetical protein OMDBNIEC_00034 [Salmonella phage STP-SP5]|nr:hypothetical protein OMDBNIEC_00034 [Salmonella phage STP-SP5]